MSDASLTRDVADALVRAEAAGVPIPPVRTRFAAGDVAGAYAVQAELTRRRRDAGERLVGRKIGLTSRAVQVQLGVDQPDYGALFAGMEVACGGTMPAAGLIAPRIEAEVAVVLARDLTAPDLGMADLLRAVAFALPALEIVDSRIAGWDIGIVDTVADNGSSARFVLGTEPRLLAGLDLATMGMALAADGRTVSVGSGAACLGHPMHAALWLARAMAGGGDPLLEGDVVLTGALGPMVDARAGMHFEARFGGFAPVSVAFA